MLWVGPRVVCLSVAALVATTVGITLVAVAALLQERMGRVTLHGAGYIAHVLGVLLLALVRVVAILALLARGRGCLLPLTGGLIFPRRDLSR